MGMVQQHVGDWCELLFVVGCRCVFDLLANDAQSLVVVVDCSGMVDDFGYASKGVVGLFPLTSGIAVVVETGRPTCWTFIVP